MRPRGNSRSQKFRRQNVDKCMVCMYVCMYGNRTTSHVFGRGKQTWEMGSDEWDVYYKERREDRGEGKGDCDILRYLQIGIYIYIYIYTYIKKNLQG